MKRRKAQPWFIKVRASYLPQTWQAWVLYVPYSFYLLAPLVYAQMHSYDIGQMLFLVIPNWVAALLIMTWIAERTSKK